ncbi:MAG: hypothetical protein IKY89_05470 [Alistipes sp.]|nr:hypothetical protein [Alistipes sp.]
MKDMTEQTVEISVEEYCDLREKARRLDFTVCYIESINDKLRDIERHLDKISGGVG